MNKLLLALCALSFSFLLTSCGDDGESPVVNFESPTDNSVFKRGEVMNIVITATDDVDITNLRVESAGFLIPEDVEGLGGSSDTNFTTTANVTLVDAIPTGDYIVEATATDNDGNVTKASVNVTIEE